ncbi:MULTISPECIES: Fpg/Nei family DNA glycosylase [unclassified Microcella]|uniref:Fpg/Nei family DNA glycosylase n=1 Tax=unclassified Microcella TaxID=2630066 RepID=UPI0006F1F8DC|nr:MULTISPECIES: DNA glycosylase [unclassified Microcella]KQV24687.1 DNA glycosylase [Yonghaparkia sp. Root332]KRF30976.1 DNA glycosylase [Yonghaparkia sp. Soil809]
MPEGHSVHRIARQFGRHFVGERISASSPQGRFAEGASLIDGRVMTDAKAVGKQMFLEFDDAVWLRVHLGIYGAWDFSGAVASAAGRMGQTGMRGASDDDVAAAPTTVVGAHEESLASIGAPRRTRLRMAEQESESALDDAALEGFPPEPIGAVRVRLLTERAVADLRGPTACEVLDAAGVQQVIDKLGPDPLIDDADAGEERMLARIRRRRVPIGLLLMDQSVVSGIGNVYRAEILFRARLDPHALGANLPEDVIRGLWRDWRYLLGVGVDTGQMLTMDGLDEEARRLALRNRADRHWVYKREGLPCRVCGTHIVMEIAAGRKLYYCPSCQV